MNYWVKAVLPVVLAGFFTIQNIFYNVWLGLYQAEYFTRLSAVTFSLGIILYLPAFFLKEKAKYVFLFCISIAISFLFVGQFLYFKYCQSFVQFSAIKYLWQIEGITGTIMAIATPHMLLFLANIFLVLIAFFIESRPAEKFAFAVLPAQKGAIFLLILAVAFSGYLYLFHKEDQERGSTEGLYADIYDLNDLIAKAGVANFFIIDAAKYFLRSDSVSESDKNSAGEWVKAKQKTGNSAKYFGSLKNKNLIIIQVESLETSLINKKIYGQEITPSLNKILKEGLFFDNYYAAVGPGNTADAEFSTMTSLYPLANDVVFVSYAENKYEALPALLKNSGYFTCSLHGDAPAFWNRANIYPRFGYDKMFSLSDFKITRSVGKGPSDLGDEDLFSQSLEKIKNFRQPFMATIITMSMHTPFEIPEDLQTLNLPEKTNFDWWQWQYLQSAHYTDKAIGDFITRLKEDGLYDNSVIFIWGDHSSFTNISNAFGENNLLPELEENRVPLIILNAGIAGTLQTPASHLDLFPTIANLFGLPKPSVALGQDLLNAKNPSAALFEPVSGEIDTVITESLIYNNEKCYELPAKKELPGKDCADILDKEKNTFKISNILIRGNLSGAFLK